MISQVLRLGQLGVGAFVVAALAVELARRPMVLVYALLGVHFWELVGAVPAMRVAGIGFSPIDAVNVVAFGAALIRLRRPHGLQWPLLGFTTLVLFAVGRAVVTFGQGDALLGFRAELYFIVPALLASSLRPQDVMPALRAVWRFGLLLSAVAVARWFLLAFGFDVGYAPDTGGYEVARTINSGATLVVSVASVMGIWRWLNDRSSAWFLPWISLGMLAVVVFAQHRSVWVATALMLVVTLARARRRRLLRLGLVVSLVTLVVVVETLGLGGSGAVADSLTYAASNTGTWEWRLERWQNVWNTHAARGPGAVVFGSGYGYSWVSGSVGVWEASPHSGYLQVAVRTGLVGAALLFGAYLAVVFRLWRRRDVSSGLLQTVSLGVLTYFVPYSGSVFSGLLLGLGVAVFAHCVAAETRLSVDAPSGQRPVGQVHVPR